MKKNAFARVAVGRPVRGEFTYTVPEALEGQLRVGQRVLVPFGKSPTLAFYLGDAESPSAELEKKLKPIVRVLEEEPALTEDVLSLLRFAAEHYRYPLGEAIRSALPPGLSLAQDEKPARPTVVHRVRAVPEAEGAPLSRAPAQRAVLHYLQAVGGWVPLEEVSHAIPGARESLKKLVERGLVEWRTEEVQAQVREELAQSRPALLTPEQAECVDALTATFDEGGFQPVLLHGVTGSGKTEVYLRLVEHALAQGKGSLVLVPEIALTPQLLGRFQSRFGPQVALLHSSLKDNERLRHWQALRRGEARVAVGVRSAVFAPVQDLGLLVVDEEHDPSFKQEEKLRYHARDLAVVRARQTKSLVVLGSATPSLETLENARRARYRLLTMSKRVDDRPMPKVELVDLRQERPKMPGLPQEEASVLAPPLVSAMREVLDKGQQIILFLNRRGYSSFLVCETCGATVRCHDCDVSLTFHLSSRRMVCHYCGESKPVPENCPECRGTLLRLGMGTERVEAEVASTFPKARVARLDRDSTQNAEKLTGILAAFAQREIDILVGTQMVAKGHDFPGVTLVCVVMADTALALPDFRAAERTFHLLTQVGGRAGRGRDPGRVLIQTYNPDSEPLKRVVAHDFEGFSNVELSRRRALAYPPYTRLVAIRIEGPHPGQTAETAETLGHVLARHLPPASLGVRLLGPALAPISRIKGKTRWQILLKGPSHAALSGPLSALERKLPELPAQVRVVIDVDVGALL